MKYRRIAEPDYDYIYEQIKGVDILGESIFTTDVSFTRCIKGSAKITINSRIHNFVSGANCLVLDSAIFQVVECTNDFVLDVCRFSMQFFNEIYPLLDNKIMEVIMLSSPDRCPIEKMFNSNVTFDKLIHLYNGKDIVFKHKIAMNLVMCYIYETYNSTYMYINTSTVKSSSNAHHLIDLFFGLCDEFHVKHRKIDFDAEKLNIASRYLYKITKEALKITPKNLIDYYLSGTSKKLLLTTNLSNQQIADKLNFPDQATFGQFFKRTVGLSPSEFKRLYR